jgi:hypothetical protein
MAAVRLCFAIHAWQHRWWRIPWGEFMRKLILCFVLMTCGLLGTPGKGASRAPAAMPVIGLSHVPVAVKDLSAASKDFARLGFVLKPGHPHDDGIQNEHVKFTDGTEIELISASRAVDSTTASYVTFLAQGDGPAFLALYAPNLQKLAAWLDQAKLSYLHEDGWISFPEDSPYRNIFFAGLNYSPTDIPRYFEHPNGATRLLAVWFAAKDFTAQRKLFLRLGVTRGTDILRAGGETRIEIMHFRQGEIRLLPSRYEVTPGHSIVGMSLETSDLGKLEHVLRQAGLRVPDRVATRNGTSLTLPPALTHGVWLEFLQEKR